MPTRQFYFAPEPLGGHLLEAPFVPDELYSYAAMDLPAELMEWQRAEFREPAQAEAASTALVSKTASKRLPSPTPPWTMEVRTPESGVVSGEADVVEAQVVEKKIDPEDPFLD